MCTPGFLHRCLVFKPRPLKLCGKCSYPLNLLPRTEGKLLGNHYASINVLRACSAAVCVCVSVFMCVGVYMWTPKVRGIYHGVALKFWNCINFKIHLYCVYICVHACTIAVVHMQRSKDNSGKLVFSFNHDGAQSSDPWQTSLFVSHLTNPYHVFWDPVSHWDLGLSHSASLTCWWSPGVNPSLSHLCLYSVGAISMCCYCAWGFLWVLQINLGSSCSCNRHVADWDVSPPQTWTTLIVKIPCKMEAPFIWKQPLIIPSPKSWWRSV